MASKQEKQLLSEDIVKALAKLGRLELDESRRLSVTAQLEALLTDANEVNRFMERRVDVAPAVSFRHIPAEEES